jgi:hypothetical protein
MKQITTIPLASLLGVATLAASGAAQNSAPNPTTAADKIVIEPAMIVNEVARGNAFELFDEQVVAGDPRSGSKGRPTSVWGSGQDKIYYPLTAYVDLGAIHHLTDIFVYDANGVGDFRVENGTPFKWQPLVSDPLKSYLTWNRHAVDVRTRYLRFTIPDGGTRVPEIVLYGKPQEPVQPVKVPEAKRRPFALMNEMIGTNAFIDDPHDKMAAVGYIREYHTWGWDAGNAAYPNNAIAFNPSYAGGGGWNFDEYYTKLKNAGIMVAPAIKGSAKWIADKPDYKPVDVGQDATNPASYQAHADHMFQFAARYGSTKVADARLKLAPNQPRLSGMGLLRYFENGNEPNAWWHGRAGYSTPYELAAQSSADYDGHRKTMGSTFGIKNADPNAQLVMAGLAGLDLNYIKAMKAWADWNRAGDFPADVLNVHTYSNNIGGQGNSRVGISPEQDRLKERLQELTDYRDRYLPGKELWLTEFGYDTHPASTQGAHAIGETTTEETQARWLVRSFLAIAAAGVDRAAQYMLRDVNPQDGTKYSTSGLVTQKGEWKPKTSWYYTYTMKNRLAGMRFAGEVASGNPKVLIYKFKADKGNGAYVVWCPTAENATVSNFALPVTGAKTAIQVTLQNGETNGISAPLAIAANSVTLQVSEKPIFVMVDQM